MLASAPAVAVDGNRCGRERAGTSAHHHKLAANFADSRAIVFAKIRDNPNEPNLVRETLRRAPRKSQLITVLVQP